MVPLASFAFIGGMITGSFVGVVAHRVPRRHSIVGPRSECPSCGAQIAAYDNVPVVSWLLLGGHCRSCHARIPARYPLIELGVGLAFAATALALRGDPGIIPRLKPTGRVPRPLSPARPVHGGLYPI